jgi:hypothetical protein
VLEGGTSSAQLDNRALGALSHKLGVDVEMPTRIGRLDNVTLRLT